MTQGTKIGLLVSLAFLIVIFVLLSDHAVHSNDVRPAPVTTAAPNVARGLTVPGAAQSDATPAAMRIEARIEPVEPVPTVQEMIDRPSLVGTAVVDVGPGRGRTFEVNAVNHVPTNVRIAPPIEVGPDVNILSLGEMPQSLQEQFIPVNTGTQATPTAVAEVPQATRHHEYKAMPGDTVSRIARKYYGSDAKPNRDLIIAANASLRKNPDRIVVGQTYIVPMKSAEAPVAAVAAAPAANVAGPAANVTALASAASPANATQGIVPPTPAPTPAKERIYVVKAGDSLWKIAATQCRGPSAIDEIRRLNRDVLKSDSALKVGMKLKLPN